MNHEEYLLTYCDELIPTLFDELKGTKDEPEIPTIIPLLIFQSLVDKLRALQVLRDNGQARVGESSYAIARTMYECQWYLLYIIKEDSNFRASAYYYFSRLDEATSEINDIIYKIDEQKKYLRLRKKYKGNKETYRRV